jgi:hypothetical protein
MYGLLSPGLAQPPPGRGDGLRDSDMGRFGVPGIGGKMVTPLRDGELSVSTPEASCVLTFDGTFELDADDRRRRCENDPPVEKGEVGVRDARTRSTDQKALGPSGNS